MTGNSGNDPWPTWPEPADPPSTAGTDPTPTLKGHTEINNTDKQGWSWVWIIAIVLVVIIILILLVWFFISGSDTTASVLDSLRDPKNSIEPK